MEIFVEVHFQIFPFVEPFLFVVGLPVVLLLTSQGEVLSNLNDSTSNCLILTDYAIVTEVVEFVQMVFTEW